jgi:hypothetical protein
VATAERQTTRIRGMFVCVHEQRCPCSVLLCSWLEVNLCPNLPTTCHQTDKRHRATTQREGDREREGRAGQAHKAHTGQGEGQMRMQAAAFFCVEAVNCPPVRPGRLLAVD